MHEISDANIRELVDTFYAKVRADPDLGPIFDRAIQDNWDAHLATMVDFWASVMLTAGRYKGNPFAAHRPLQLRPEMFDVWLGLWRESTAELFEPQVAALFDAKAERIAESLMAGLFFRPADLAR